MIMEIDIIEIIAAIMFFMSFYGLITSKNVIKSIIFIGTMEISVIMFFLSLGFKNDPMPPIGVNPENAADPLPQALMITAIIIGLAVTAVNLTMLISLSRQTRKTDWDTVKNTNTEY